MEGRGGARPTRGRSRRSQTRLVPSMHGGRGSSSCSLEGSDDAGARGTPASGGLARLRRGVAAGPEDLAWRTRIGTWAAVECGGYHEALTVLLPKEKQRAVQREKRIGEGNGKVGALLGRAVR